VSQPPPAYPQQARQAGISGTVRLSVLVAKDGTVHDLRVQSTPSMDLAIAAIEAVKHWTYQPTLLNGEPVEVATTVNVTFN
jgi:TonB family protein